MLACERCERPFVATRPGQRFCEERCRKAAERQRHYERHGYYNKRTGRPVRACFDLRAGRVVSSVNDNDAGRYRAALAADPCPYCGGPTDTAEHVDPTSRGGAFDWTNLVHACADCNVAKSDKTLLAFLLARPVQAALAALTSEMRLLNAVGPPRIGKQRTRNTLHAA
jgi:5-methylcytosine-specific restriction endonuclease McrA